MYLLDTHVLLWYFSGNSKLGNETKKIIESSICYYSPASLWEIAIKQSLKKIDLNISIPELENTFLLSGLLRLQMTSQHFENIKTLGDIHKDPFDRLLVAQAQSEDIPIVTGDRFIKMYKVQVVDVYK